MSKKLIIVNGVMGVGKTTICKKLYKALPNTFWLDGDWCWMMNPFIVNEENKRMVLENISFQLKNFLKNSSSEYVVFNWVIHSDEIMDDLLKLLDGLEFDLYKITLMCSKEKLIERIENDIRLGLRDEANVSRSLEKFNLYAAMDTIKVDTTGKTIEMIVDEIKDIVNS
ncbi:MAG: AAA family ATPase [Clostridium sp.]